MTDRMVESGSTNCAEEKGLSIIHAEKATLFGPYIVQISIQSFKRPHVVVYLFF